MSPTLYYLQHGEEEVAPAPKRPRAAAEFEVRPGRNKDDQLAVVVAALLDDQKSEPLDSLKTVFAGVISELRTWEDEAKARRILNGEEQNDAEEPRKHVTSISVVCLFLTCQDLKFGDANLTTAIFKDGKLQLLLKLMGAERFGERGLTS
jgi:replication fork protection complex subunit Tof1/Swi1